MNGSVWYFVLVCVGGPTCTPGTELGAIKAGGGYYDAAAFSEASCAEHAKEIAKAMFISTHGDRYGFRCLVVDYDPPDMSKIK